MRRRRRGVAVGMIALAVAGAAAGGAAATPARSLGAAEPPAGRLGTAVRRASVAPAGPLGAAARAAARAGWGEAPFRALGAGRVATCLRVAGPGRVAALGPLTRRTSAIDLFAAGPDGLAPAGRVTLGWLDDCPAVAAEPGGHVVVAGAVRAGGRQPRYALRAAVAGAAGRFAAPVELAPARSALILSQAAAVSPAGDVVVAWAEQDPVERPSDTPVTRIVAVRGTVPGGFGAPQTLVRLRAEWVIAASLAAGVDDGGRATVAWVAPQRGSRAGAQMGRLAVATGERGQAFTSATRLERFDAPFTSDLALAVAGDGGALLAVARVGGLDVFERAPGASGFVRRLRRTTDLEPTETVAALAPGGGAVVAWRSGATPDDLGVQAVLRSRPGAFGAPLTIARPPRRSATGGGWTAYLVAGGNRPAAPLDLAGARLGASLSADGRVLLAWPGLAPARDPIPRATVVTGTLGRGFNAPIRLGSPIRATGAVVPLATAHGPGVAWTDNLTGRVLLSAPELPAGGGRLHLALAGRASAPAPAPPRIALRARAQTLAYDDPLRVTVSCARACDVRAVVPHAGRRTTRGERRTLEKGPLATGTASLPHAGRVSVSLQPQRDVHVAPSGGGRVRVLARATAPGGAREATATVRVQAYRRPLPPLAVPRDVRARRAGRDVIVTWRTARPALRASFSVEGRTQRTVTDPEHTAFVEGRGRRHFRVRLRDAPRVRFAAVDAIADDPPHRQRTVVAPVRS